MSRNFPTLGISLFLLAGSLCSQALPELIPFRKGDKWGYVDSTKKIIVPCRFTKVTQQERGYGLVFNGDKYGFVDSTGRIFHEAEFDFDINHYSSVFEGNFLRVMKNGKCGLVDGRGKWRVNPQYESLAFMEDGRLRAELDGKKGIIDTAGKVLITLSYDYILATRNGNYIAGKAGKYGMIDKNQNIITPFRYDWIRTFSEGMVTVCIVQRDAPGESVLFGYVDSSGKEVAPCIYTAAGDFHNGRAVVGKDFKYGYIDNTGKLVIPLNYDCAKNFSGGMASVGIDGKYGYINTSGKLVVPMVYKTMHNTCGEEFRNGTVTVMRDWQWAIVDTTGKEIIPPSYSGIYWDHRSRYLQFEKDEKSGMMTIDQEIVIPPFYEQCRFEEGIFVLTEPRGRFFYRSTNGDTLSGKIYDRGDNVPYFTVPHFHEGRGLIIENDKAGFIDSTGRVVIPCKYDSAWVFRDGISLVESAGKPGYVDRYGREYWED